MAGPRSEATARRVRDLAMANTTLSKMSEIIGISQKTITTLYREDLNAAGYHSAGAKAAHVPDPDSRKTVELMASVGISVADIATVLKVNPSVVKKHYAEELETAAIRANARVGANIFRAATGDVTKPATVTASIWWSKNRMNWADKSDDRLHVTKDPNELSDAELERIALRGSASAPPSEEGEE
jgi:AraC-like DNA-binding protein